MTRARQPQTLEGSRHLTRDAGEFAWVVGVNANDVRWRLAGGWLRQLLAHEVKMERNNA